MPASAATILPFPQDVVSHLCRQPAPGHARSLERHDTVFLAGDPATQLFEVVKGVAMVSMLLDDGRRQIVELVFPGGIVGLSSTGHYAVSCETLTPALLRVHRRHELALDQSSLQLLAAQLERQICAMHGHALALGRKTAQEKVASLLLRFLEAEQPARPAHRGRLDLPMTRSDMGDYLGLSLETVCRTLTDLQGRGVLEIGRQHGVVTIKDVKRLRALASISIDD